MSADPVGALLDEEPVHLAGAGAGPLAGTTFVAKDLFDVAGHVTGAGQPTWRATHGPAPSHATAVRRLLDAGADLVGRTHTAEMAYSLSGRDSAYRAPVNAAAPDRDTGGSSSGSAAAVAGGLADLGLGTDTLGSIRVPASCCGLHGWRPTHGLVPADGVHPLAPSLDTVGLLARDADTLARGASVLAGRPLDGSPVARVLVAADAFDLLEPGARAALRGSLAAFEPAGERDLAPPWADLATLTALVRDVQGPEFAAAHGAWITAHRPTFVPAVAERVAHALAVTPPDHAAAEARRERLVGAVGTWLGPDTVVVLPAAAPPPLRDAPEADVAGARRVSAALSVVGSLARLPTVTVPAVVHDGAPLGLSLLGARGADGALLSLAARRPAP